MQIPYALPIKSKIAILLTHDDSLFILWWPEYIIIHLVKTSYCCLILHWLSSKINNETLYY